MSVLQLCNEQVSETSAFWKIIGRCLTPYVYLVQAMYFGYSHTNWSNVFLKMVVKVLVFPSLVLVVYLEPIFFFNRQNILLENLNQKFKLIKYYDHILVQFCDFLSNCWTRRLSRGLASWRIWLCSIRRWTTTTDATSTLLSCLGRWPRVGSYELPKVTKVSRLTPSLSTFK